MLKEDGSGVMEMAITDEHSTREATVCYCRGCAPLKRRTKVLALCVGVLLGVILSISAVVAIWQTVMISPYMASANKSMSLHVSHGFTPGLIETEELTTAVLTSPEDITEPLEVLFERVEAEDWTLYLRRPLYVGVLSLEASIASRGAACNLTWAQHPLLQGRVDYYSHLTDANLPPHPHLVNLTGITGEDIWHQEKSFLMLEEMCEHHLHDYDWFIRSVDDVYIKVDRLISFLATLDKTKQVYTGHPTVPVTDQDFRAHGGQRYCYGGAAIVMSRPLLQGLCPHLSTCRQEHLPAAADVALARCIDRHLNIKCAAKPKRQGVFYHSYQDNYYKLMEELSSQDQAITLHPVKAPWLMTALHHTYTSGRIDNLTAKLRSLVASKFSTHGKRVEATTGDISGGSDVIGVLADDVMNRQIVPSFFTESARMRSGACQAMETLSTHDRDELSKVVRLAESSTRLGDLLLCNRIISRYARSSLSSKHFELDMLCKAIPNQQGGKPLPSSARHSDVITRVSLTAQLSSPRITKIRTRTIRPELVFLLSCAVDDLHLITYLLQLQDIIGDKMEQFGIYVILDDASMPSQQKSQIKHPPETEYFPHDLQAWYRRKKINLNTVYVHHFSNRTQAFQHVTTMIRTNHPDATVMLSQINSHIDKEFLLRCRALIRPGKHMYRPVAVKDFIPQYITANSLPLGPQRIQWDNPYRPMCIHSSDLTHLLNVSHPTAFKLPSIASNRKHKTLKIISAVDTHILT